MTSAIWCHFYIQNFQNQIHNLIYTDDDQTSSSPLIPIWYVMVPRILLTNDDGVNSEGLWAAYDALAPIADVLVCAPATQQSAVGRSVSIFEPLRVNEIIHNDVQAYSVGGKPTDSVIIGLFALNLKPDLVVSGINIGENVSAEAVTTSGTVGAALEAANQGIPAVAFSLQVEDQAEKFEKIEYEPEQFPGLVYRLDDPKVVVLLFGSGKLIITGGKLQDDARRAVLKIMSDLKGLGLL
jgi:hypothetical protein